MKRFATFLLALVMILSLAIPAAAEGEATKNDSITINNAKAGETYAVYKMFDLVVDNDENPTKYSYTVNSDWAAFFAAAKDDIPAGKGYQYIVVNDLGYVTGINDSAALAKAAATWAGKPGATQTVTVAKGATTAVFDNLANGYWLVTSTLGTIAMAETTPDANAVTITEKNPENTISKEVKEDSTGKWGETNDAQVGDTVEFKSVVKIVKGTRNVVVHDKMDAGLTYTAGSVAIAGLTKGTEYTVNEETTDGDTFCITFDQTWIDNLNFGTDGYKEFEITYSATLNENAVVKNKDGVAIVDQNNKTHVSFGDATNSTEDTTTTTTHSFSVFKYYSSEGEKIHLADAVFSLKKADAVVNLVKIDDNNYRIATAEDTTTTATFITVATGDIVIWGVDDDENDKYTLEEITAPEGYNKLTAEVNVTVKADNSTRVDVENKSGTELPSTGGVGTTMFYIFGGILVLAAVVLLVTKKRMATAE